MLALGFATPASAGIYSVAPADEEGPEYAFMTNDALWTIGTSEPTTGVGQVCAVSENVYYTASCKQGLWGRPNAIAIHGTYHQPIDAPPLPPGTYRLLGDNGGDGSENSLSEPFTITPCVENCSNEIGQALVQQWKDAAAAARAGMEAGCRAASAYQADGKLQAAVAVLGPMERDSLLAEINEDVTPGTDEISFSRPQQTVQGVAMAIARRVSCGAYIMYDDIVNDPPDPDYKHDTLPEPETTPHTWDGATNEFLTSFEQLRAAGVAQRIAFERYQGADQAGDRGWAAFQLQRAGTAGFDLQQGMRRASEGLRDLGADLAADPSIQPASTEQLQDARDLRARIRTEGFTSGEVTQLRDLGYADTEIARIREQMGTPIPAGGGGVHPGTGFADAADDLDATSCYTAESSCGFDGFSRTVAAVGAATAVPPKITVHGSTTIREGDRGVNHARVRYRLSHPAPRAVMLGIHLTPVTTADGEIAADPTGWYLPEGALEGTVEFLVKNDTEAEPDETASLRIDGDGLEAADGVTVTIDDDDGADDPPKPARSSTLAMTHRYGVTLADPAGTNVEEIWTDTEMHRLAVDWSRNGRFVLLHHNPHTGTEASTTGAPYYMLPMAENGQPAGAPVELTPYGVLKLGAGLSPDGSRVAMSHYVGWSWELEILKVKSDGTPDGPPHRLGEALAAHGLTWQINADWSPSGDRIVFDSCNLSQTECGIWTAGINADGGLTGAPTPVVPARRYPSVEAPQWSPDGRFVSYVDHRDGQVSLRRVKVDSSGAPVGDPVTLVPAGVTSAGGYASSPTWSPDSRAIVYVANENQLTPASTCYMCAMVLELDGEGRPAGAPRHVSPFSFHVGTITWGTLPDDTPPVTRATLDRQPNATGWHAGAVAVTLAATDGGSGVKEIRHAVGAAPLTATAGDTAEVTLARDGEHVLRYRAVDRAGRMEAEQSLTVRIDSTAPSVTIDSPATGTAVDVGSGLTAHYGCADAGGSGLADCAGTVPAGAELDTSSPGTRTLTVTATDRAGNTASASREWTVRAPSQPPASEPPPDPVVAPPSTQAAKLPSNRKCVSRRRFRIRLVEPKDDRLVRATVVLNGKKIKVVKGKRLTAMVDLRGLPKGRFKVVIRAVTRSGRTLKSSRKYRTCLPKRKR